MTGLTKKQIVALSFIQTLKDVGYSDKEIFDICLKLDNTKLGVHIK